MRTPKRPARSARSTLTVGVTGHRPNRMHIGEAAIARQIHQVLKILLQGSAQTRNGRPHALSSVAEGADRLFAQAALELGFELTALLPFARAEYETTFSNASTTPHFRALLNRALRVIELPGSLADAKSAYVVSGRAIVDQSDIVIAVWDGRPAAGRGGTPEIIEYATARNKPVIWIDTAQPRAPRLIRQEIARHQPSAPLSALAARARPLTPAMAARLVAGSQL